ncbi:BBP7 family outer membrane beta-barrel protein [Aeoliella sp. ICT_H6.2]|uniref:BBP7 family outer membrane beta-barrel protein n=1 Tax=Aeoliella straminimaris TaxID=2954799 RepID=A0A9X2FJC8_9BACT|nr:BBP7 family outer membrane beta-barrel protein [Aeoliella straminimaris]MCO6046981.1 BBP7 family outer membrane beta-barrel protein [Aeoliella straminimaris]
MSRTICVSVAVVMLAAVSQVNAQGTYPQAASGAYNPAPNNVDWQSYVAPRATPYQGGYRVASGTPTPVPQGYTPAANPNTASYLQAPAGYHGGVPSSGGCESYSSYEPCCPAPSCDPCPTPCTRCWYASLGALFLTREPQDNYTFSYDSANEDDQYVDAANADMDFAPGVEATVGWYDCCTNVGFELTYWQLFPGDESTQMLGADLAPGFLDGIRNYDQLDYNGGTADANVNAAQIHRLTRGWEVYNVEANRVIVFRQNGCASPWQFQSLAGFRYFKFKETLGFVSDPTETIIDGDLDEYRINIDTDNQLFGFQLGGISERAIGQRWTIRLIGKAGLYNNHITMNYFEGGAAGAAVINNGPNAGQAMIVNASTNDLAFLGEFGAGVTCRVGNCWRLGADYRMIGVTGIALPTDQIYFDTRGINDVRIIDNDASLLLHGAFVRVERSF